MYLICSEDIRNVQKRTWIIDNCSKTKIEAKINLDYIGYAVNRYFQIID